MTIIRLEIGNTDSKWKEAKNYIVKCISLGNPDIQVTKKRNQAAVKVIVHRVFPKV